ETSRTENELSDGETPEAVLASKEIASTVNAAIEALSDDLRQAITLREIEGLSYEEIADLMNCPIGTVRSRIFRAREAIAQRTLVVDGAVGSRGRIRPGRWRIDGHARAGAERCRFERIDACPRRFDRCTVAGRERAVVFRVRQHGGAAKPGRRRQADPRCAA